jgi:hypothetical protein
LAEPPKSRVKKLAIVVLFVLAGCRRQVQVGSAPGSNTPGAASAREALQFFMAAAKAQDIQAMSNVWGTSSGPARSTMDKDELEKREIYMMLCLKHDSYHVLGEAPSPGGERVMAAEIKFQDLTRTTNFIATRGPNDRWYVRTLELEALNDICARRS